MSTSARRPWIRVGLGAGVLLATGGLLLLLGVGRSPGSAGPPPLARPGGAVRVQVVDVHGRLVPEARAYVLRRPGEDGRDERWSPAESTLTMAARPGGRTVLVTARGFRMQEVPAVVRDTQVTLERGLRVRFALRNAPRALEDRNIRFLLRLRPDADLVAAAPGLGAAGLVDLMAHTAGPGSGPRGLPRGEFGYAVSRRQARKGILVPAPGRYRVHWGLIDLDAGTWFSLGDECGRAVLVQDGTERYVLDVTEGHLEKTLAGLKTSVHRLDAASEED